MSLRQRAQVQTVLRGLKMVSAGRTGLPLVMFLCLALLAGPRGSATAGPDPVPARGGEIAPATEKPSWLGRLFNRYLRAKPQTGEILRGRAEETASRYVAYAGWTIEVVLVNQVETFDEDWHERKGFGTRLFNNLTTPLQQSTQDGTIRRQLLFRAGQPLDPVALADTEILLRSLPFIDDVRIMVVPLTGQQESVAVVVESRDSWPLGIDGKIVDKDRYNASLYSVNLFGRGLACSNELVHNAGDQRPWGYHGHVRQPNPTGHFTDLDLDYEDSWRRLRRQVSVEKNLVHQGVRLVGGGELEVEDDRDNDGIPRKFSVGDFWLGRALRLNRKAPAPRQGTLLLVPAVGYRRVRFSERPEVTLSTNRSYHDRTLVLAGLSLVRIRDFKTSYFYRMGETEDIRAGWQAQVAVAYEDGEFQKRSGNWLRAGMVSVGDRGRVLAVGLAGGGYWRSGDFEEGVLDASAFFATRLYGLGAFGQRWYLRARYTRGFDRFLEETISLDNRSGLRGVEDGVLTGRQRLVSTLETRLFTPWSLLGFRCLLLGYVDAGIIAGQDESLAGRRVLISSGLGLRLDNPQLVLPPLQVRVGVRDEARGSDTVVEIVFGGGRSRENFLYPAVKPQPVAFR